MNDKLWIPDSPRDDLCGLLSHIVHIKVDDCKLRVDHFGEREIIKSNNCHLLRNGDAVLPQSLYAPKGNVLVRANDRLGAGLTLQ